MGLRLSHPAEQQDHEQYDQQTEENAGCVHRATPLGESLPSNGMAEHSLAENLRCGEFQMDWLRSEDLKEEKNVTAPIVIIALHALCRCHEWRGVPLVMQADGPDLRGRHNRESGCPTLREVRSVGIPAVGIKRLS